jgi:formate-dependent nitrite reductase membrane component NrfD
MKIMINKLEIAVHAMNFVQIAAILMGSIHNNQCATNSIKGAVPDSQMQKVVVA